MRKCILALFLIGGFLPSYTNTDKPFDDESMNQRGWFEAHKLLAVKQSQVIAKQERRIAELVEKPAQQAKVIAENEKQIAAIKKSLSDQIWQRTVGGTLLVVAGLVCGFFAGRK